MRKKRNTAAVAEAIETVIHEIRGTRVILDSDLAKIYGVPTFRFNEAIKRNRHRFPRDFMFQLTRSEFDALKRKSATPGKIGSTKSTTANSSQIAMSSRKHRGATYRPFAFTEYGALQAANVLRSARAVQMSVFVIRAFVKMRDTLRSTDHLAKKLAFLEKQLTGRLNAHEVAIVHVLQEMMQILNPPPEPPGPPRPKIGFKP